MFMTIFTFGFIFNKVYVFSVSYIDSRTGFSTEFVEMFIIKICAEFYFVHMFLFFFAILFSIEW